MGEAVLLEQRGPPRAGGARRLRSRGAVAPHAQSKLMGRTAGIGGGGASPSRAGKAGAAGRGGGGDPMHGRACAVHAPWAMRKPFMCRLEPAGLRAVAVANIS